MLSADLSNTRKLTLEINGGVVQPVVGVGPQGAPGPGSAAWTALEAVTAATVRQAPDGSYIRATTSRTTRATFDSTEQGFWAPVLATAGTLENTALLASIEAEVGTLVPSASTSAQGKVELATTAETLTGTDTVRAVTPAAAATVYAPGGTAGNLGTTQLGQYLAPTSRWTGANDDLAKYGGDPTGAADSTAALNALNTDLTAAGGGDISITGVYKFTSQPAAFTVPVRIRGRNPSLSGGRAVMNFAAGIGGLRFSGNADLSEVSDLLLVGFATTAGSDHGIDIKSHGVRCRNVTARGFGGNGFNLDTSSTGNANNSLLDRCRSYSNKGHGYYFAGSNSNIVTTLACDATSNGGWGFRSDSGCFQNTHIAPSATFNTGGGIYDNVVGCAYLGVYIEEGAPGTGNTVTLGASSLNGYFYSGKCGTTTFTRPLPATDGWVVSKAGASNGAGGQQFQKLAGTVNWDTSVDEYSTGYWALTNRSAAKRIMVVNGTGTSGSTLVPWKFTGAFIQVPAAVTGSRPAANGGVGLHMFDTTLNKPIWSDGTNWRDATGTIV